MTAERSPTASSDCSSPVTTTLEGSEEEEEGTAVLLSPLPPAPAPVARGAPPSPLDASWALDASWVLVEEEEEKSCPPVKEKRD